MPSEIWGSDCSQVFEVTQSSFKIHLQFTPMCSKPNFSLIWVTGPEKELFVCNRVITLSPSLIMHHIKTFSKLGTEFAFQFSSKSIRWVQNYIRLSKPSSHVTRVYWDVFNPWGSLMSNVKFLLFLKKSFLQKFWLDFSWHHSSAYLFVWSDLHYIKTGESMMFHGKILYITFHFFLAQTLPHPKTFECYGLVFNPELRTEQPSFKWQLSRQFSTKSFKQIKQPC